MATWEDVRRLALELPDTVESTSYRRPCVQVRGKTFVNLSPHENGALVVRCAPEEQALRVAALPDVYFTTPHYAGYGAVLLRLETVPEEELAASVEDAYAYVSRKKRCRT